MYHRIYFTLFIILATCLSAFAQQPYMWHISDEDGLPSNEVYQIYQDKKGYIWMGTDNGAANYDGHTFKVLSCDGQQGRAIGYFNEDSKGRIWCINFSGQTFWIENDSLHLLKAWSKYQKSHFPIISIDGKDNLWISSLGNTLIKYDIDKKLFKESSANGIVPSEISNVCCIKNQLYIADVHDGPKILNNSTFNTIPITVPPNKKIDPSNFEFSEQPDG